MVKKSEKQNIFHFIDFVAQPYLDGTEETKIYFQVQLIPDMVVTFHLTIVSKLLLFSKILELT